MIFSLALYDEDLSFFWLGNAIFYLSLFVSVLVCAYLFLPFGVSEGSAFFKSDLKKQKSLVSYETIGSGPMTLNPHLFFRSVPSLLQDVVFIRRETSDDRHPFLLGIKSSRQLVEIKAGEKIYLNVDEKDPGFPRLFLTEEAGAFSLKPLLEENKAVLVEARIKKGAGLEDEPLNLLIQEQNYGDFDPSALTEFEKLPFVLYLEKGKCHGKDLLYQEYAGDQFSAYKDAVKIELPHPYHSHFYWVTKGDTLFFTQGIWQKSEERIPDAPFAEVTNVDKNEIRVIVWDSSGLLSKEISIPKVGEHPSFGMEDEFRPTLAKLRSASQISCLVGKQRLLIKNGDWLLKTNRGWRVLKTQADIRECLEHKKKGCLLIIEGLEIKEESALLSGEYFDEMRVQSKRVHTVIEMPKAVKKHASSATKKKSGKLGAKPK